MDVAELIERLLSFKPFLEAHHCATAAIDEAASAIESLSERVAELERLLNTPEVDDFAKGAALEAAHQRDRGGR